MKIWHKRWIKGIVREIRKEVGEKIGEETYDYFEILLCHYYFAFPNPDATKQYYYTSFESEKWGHVNASYSFKLYGTNFIHFYKEARKIDCKIEWFNNPKPTLQLWDEGGDYVFEAYIDLNTRILTHINIHQK